MKAKIGLDVPIRHSLYDTYKECIDLGLKSCQTSLGKTTNIYDLFKCKKLLIENPNFYTCFHGNITYNLAGSSKGSEDPQYSRKLNNCKNGLLHELDIATFLNKGVVVHIGTQEDQNIGMNQIINTINEVLIMETSETISYSRHSQCNVREFRDKRKIILENSAAKGNQLGSTLDQMSFINSQINPSLRDNVTFCIDTCHISDAGQYDFGNVEIVNNFYEDFDKKIGLKKLEAFHLNDSKYEYGSKQDRHEHLGKGYIFGKENGLNGLQVLLKKNIEYGIPMIGEFSDGKGDQDIQLINTLI